MTQKGGWAGLRQRLLGLALLTACCHPGLAACAWSASRPVTDGRLATSGRLSDHPSAIVVLGRGLFFVEDRFPLPTVIRRVDLDTAIQTSLRVSRPLVFGVEVVGAVGDDLLIGPWGGTLADYLRVNVATGDASSLLTSEVINGIGGLVSRVRGSVVDTLGNLFFWSNSQVWRLDVGIGSLRHVAGAIREGPASADTSADGGAATAAGLGWIQGVALDDAGNVFIAQSGERTDGYRVRRVDAQTGVVTTVVGPGTVVAGELPYAPQIWPRLIALDRSGRRLLIVDAGVRLLALDLESGVVAVVAGSVEGDSGDGGPAILARLSEIAGVAVDDAGDVYVADYAANRIRHIERVSGVIRPFAGNGRYPRERVFRDVQLTTALTPDRERCTNEMTPPVLAVRVRAAGVSIPGMDVRLLRAADFQDERSLSVTAAVSTDATGTATVTLPMAGNYVVLVTGLVFQPVVQSWSLSAGCTAELDVDLRFAPTTYVGGGKTIGPD